MQLEKNNEHVIPKSYIEKSLKFLLYSLRKYNVQEKIFQLTKVHITHKNTDSYVDLYRLLNLVLR